MKPDSLRVVKPLLAAIFISAAIAAAQTSPPSKLALWYAQPARDWESQALPIGNGRLGMMIFGDPQHEQLQVNEDSLWEGTETDTGAYQNLGEIKIDLSHAAAGMYRRTLDISHAVHTVDYTADGIAYHREYFASHPAEVIAVQFSANKPGAYSGTIHFGDAHKQKSTAEGNRITCGGALKNGLEYETQVLVVNQGGTVAVDGDGLRMDHADGFTLFFDARTNYINQRSMHWRTDPPHAKLTAEIDAASKISVDQLLAAQRADYQNIFHRVTIDLGAAPAGAESLPTDQRLVAYAAAEDHALEALLFQYGRYLLISSSRSSLPANLQGLWNNSNSPPWRSDYHTDVNVQMNYWPADLANMSECFEPLFQWVLSTRDVHIEQTRAEYHARGWTSRGENGVFGGSTWEWVPGGSAWLCQNLWDHYAFTQDREYLKQLYPILKEVCEFWEDHLKTLPDGTLVSPNDFSPEHGPHEDGVSFDQELVWDLFSNYIEASKAMDVDPDYRAKVTAMREKLLKPKVGKWGQLQEWMVDRDDPKDTHRHVSHLFALYPGRQISPITTPDLAKAAAVSLTHRGDLSTGWAMAWRINFWARLLDGDHAHLLLHNFLHIVGKGAKTNYGGGGGVYSNLFCAHPPFQIDGNLGSCAGIAEMLLQSQTGTIQILPALPRAWPAGSIHGLRARGNVLVDIEWNAGRLTSVTLQSPTAKTCMVKYQDKQLTVPLAAGNALQLDGNLKPAIAQ